MRRRKRGWPGGGFEKALGAMAFFVEKEGKVRNRSDDENAHYKILVFGPKVHCGFASFLCFTVSMFRRIASGLISKRFSREVGTEIFTFSNSIVARSDGEMISTRVFVINAAHSARRHAVGEASVGLNFFHPRAEFITTGHSGGKHART